MASPPFDVTAEKEGSIIGFLSRQWNFTPVVVTDVDLSGKVAVVVGANCGIGLEVARQFLGLGMSRLIIGARNQEKGKAAVADLQSTSSGEATIEIWQLDLASYDSVVAFAKRTKTLERMDYAVLNAGMSSALLTALLLPVAKTKRAAQGGPTRITVTSSDVSSWTSFKEKTSVPLFPALDKGASDLTDRMMVSKLLSQFYIAELAKRVPSSVVTINCATPGMVYDTQFNREVDRTIGGRLVKPILRRLGYTADVGARHITDAALHHTNEETHGQYLSTQKIKPMAPIIYTEEGKKVSAQLWKETMAEFAFANVEQVIEDAAKD
ncbi:short-chain dehydrogenase reductase family [Cordyceps militaris]|uniref:Short-chain dehydrogenase reductase family n=1 Tax=Cordyceps militaris TaxID=73501 RepID=A0A2H4SUZ6_CORMI|nr:short-chain dehydrogenase reductase family [Cordyceps militaris]